MLGQKLSLGLRMSLQTTDTNYTCTMTRREINKSLSCLVDSKELSKETK